MLSRLAMNATLRYVRELILMDYYFLQTINTLMLLKRYKIRKKDSKLFQRMADSICWGCYIKDNCDHGKAII